jgi:S-adenosyl-L-methionine hydrolase (adenosine-forming)
MSRSLVTLTTDFGTSDYYVAAMKAVMLSVNDRIRMVDITHEVKAQDLLGAAWILKHSAYLFPPGTVHVAVVDPGVGTDRRPVAFRHRGQYFVGPDNGMFALVTDNEPVECVELLNKEYWFTSSASSTFHGRDIFAAVAAHLSAGVELHVLGPVVTGLQVSHWAIPSSDKHGIQGWVVHIDRFGNLMTNIPASLVTEFCSNDELRIYIGTQILRGLVHTYGSVPEGDAAALIGSSGTLEIAVNKGNAAELLGVYQGAAISVIRDKAV